MNNPPLTQEDIEEIIEWMDEHESMLVILS